MGTRNLIAAVKDGEVKVAQYCQWDGYFEGQGEGVAKFIRDNLAEESTSIQFRENIDKCTFIGEEFIANAKRECGFDPNQEWVSFGDKNYERYQEQYPQFNRSTGSDIFYLILNGTTELQNDFQFAADSLWCEYAYVLNLDTNTLEIYCGFSQELKDVPAMFQRWGAEPNERGYYPVQLHTIVTFQELWDNPNYMEELAQAERDEEEEE